jgi:ABC-type transport system substrate-binding protein
MNHQLNLPSEYTSWVDNMSASVTPATNPELWYQWYEIVKEDAPNILDTFIENTAAKMELTVDYFVAEFLPND